MTKKINKILITNDDGYDAIGLKILQKIDKKLDDQTTTPSKSQKRKRGTRRVLDHYCWTHGAGNHKSCDCRFKKDGHKDTATIDNRMGGSNAFCRQARSE